VTLASAHEDAKGFVQKIVLLEDKLAADRYAREVSKMERREQFEELTLLQTRGSELCHTIISPPMGATSPVRGDAACGPLPY
jgi:hypothetical protein